jgi:coiled-coil and C2 domain-containing protein 2A
LFNTFLFHLKIPLQDGKEVKILLSVVRAYDVPVRKELDSLEDQKTSGQSNRRGGSSVSLQGGAVADSTTSVRMGSSDALKRTDSAFPGEALVRSYVEARFQGDAARTAPAAGPNPAWNQQLKLNFRSENNDLSSETLDSIRDSLHLHLFDEVAVDMIDDDDDRTSHVHKRIDRKWLGSLSIPFASLYRNARIEGTFRYFLCHDVQDFLMNVHFLWTGCIPQRCCWAMSAREVAPSPPQVVRHLHHLPLYLDFYTL